MQGWWSIMEMKLIDNIIYKQFYQWSVYVLFFIPVVPIIHL